jgi:hypothetical protein
MMDEAEQWNNDHEGHRELTHVYLTKNEIMESLSLSLSLYIYIYIYLYLSHTNVFGRMGILVLRIVGLPTLL